MFRKLLAVKTDGGCVAVRRERLAARAEIAKSKAGAVHAAVCCFVQYIFYLFRGLQVVRRLRGLKAMKKMRMARKSHGMQSLLVPAWRTVS